MTIRQRIDHWIFAEWKISSEGLGLFRIAYCLYIIFIFGLPDFGWIAGQPDYLFDPRLLSVAILANGFPGALFFGALTVLAWIGFAMLLAGWHTRKVSVVLPLIVILGKSFAYAFGKIDHDLFAWILPLVMAGANWGEAYSIDRFVHDRRGQAPRPPQGWPLALMALFIGWGMFTAALPKLLGGWLDPATQAAEAHLAYNYHVVGRQELLSTFFGGIRSRVFWELQDWLTIAFEFGVAIAIVRRRWFRAMLLVTVGFHLVVILMLNIPFIANLPAYMVFLPWNRIAKGVRLPVRFGGWALVGALLGAFGMGWLTLSWNVAGRPLGFELAVLIAAAFIGLAATGLALREPLDGVPVPTEKMESEGV